MRKRKAQLESLFGPEAERIVHPGGTEVTFALAL
jgi:hypothetical protein